MDRQSIQERFGIIGNSAALRNVIDRARQVARTEISVLIEGESGVGKELIAEVVHHLSPRKHEPMTVVNCGAIPEGLIESELFGAEKGAYTGAVEKRNGYFEEADGGTIFLDEVGEMPASAQVRLLRVLESGQFSRVGSAKTHHTDVRIIAATNKDLAREVEAGRFREDLYYRLSTVLIQIPPLRERTEDILPIFEQYLHRFTQKYNSPPKQLDEEAQALLKRYRWPGNVRELRNVAEQVVVLLRNKTVTADDLRPYLRGVGRPKDEFMPVLHEGERGGHERESSRAGVSDARERELLYRAIMELRMEVSDMKEQLHTLVSNIGLAVPREYLERGDFSSERGGDLVVVGRGEQGERDDYGSFIEDVVYEIEDEPPAGAEPPPASEQQRTPAPPNGRGGGPEEPARPKPLEQPEPEPEELPTLEEAEQQLIREALQKFDGNRRQTAQALGISERTLYRKLKEIDEDL